ncbi:hypothetical protein DEU56DRAFT_730116 [Suillus clintonianus]|uniref:uncharacterized protein n=1 Tax=Suillus clintonianus TaxID=1904413 RepID=UPI001B85E95A|nr:uncharacterized protein DEU56DRAFT_730116 [Suillus clintonianus]KAG2148856.1 hypothetical protein DEU56DRAFT_730116 [Suillus clintonianus]
MYHCPSCGKAFQDHTSIARHMSQPRSGCNTWLEDIIKLDSIIPPHDFTHSADVEPRVSQEPEFGSETMLDDFGDISGEEVNIAGAHSGTQDEGGEVTDYFPDPPLAYEDGYTFLSLFETDKNSIYRKTNLYYPFSSRADWRVAAWLLSSGLSMGKIDSFLSLEMIKDLPLSFCSARELQGRAEMLPSGPHWMSQIIPTSHPTKSPVVLYWRDPIECIASIFNHPLFHGRLDLTPRKVYSTAERLSRVYTEWMTGDDAWDMQSAIPSGATLLGTILSSDKTNITALTGDCIAHPLLISLANIHASTRLKSSSSSFVLTALLLVPKFVHKKKRMKGVLEDRLIHQCLDIVLEPLKQAARNGIMLLDPMTMAMYKQFGDDFQHEPRTKSTTLAQLAVVRSRADPLDIEAFFREAQKFRLNGVAEPFWRDWILAEPSHFLTPEHLHHIHKEFWDHDAQWLICIVGESEIDFRFSISQPVTGYRHFHAGISRLKQVTGRCQRDIQRYIIALCADAAPPGIITAIRALMQFRYLVQSPRINGDDLERISRALDEFHANKDAIIDAGARRGKGNRPITNWYIPKLELMQNIVPSIRNSGVTMQWSADVTELAHISEIKDPARASNNNNYDPQICRHLDRAEKCRCFELATSLLDSTTKEPEDLDADADVDADVDVDAQDIPIELSATQQHPGRPVTNYFAIARALQFRDVALVPIPLRSFAIGRTAFHVGYDPSIRSISVDEVAIKFSLPDLRPAIADFLQREATYGPQHVHAIGGPRRAGPMTVLPFDKVSLWYKIRLQETNFHDGCTIRPAQTLNCAPPSDPWILGRYDTAIIETTAGSSWPSGRLSGHTVAQIRLIMRPVGKSGTRWSWMDRFLTYVQCFDISHDRDLITQLHLLKRAKRSNGGRMGDIVPVSQLRAPINLIPRFGATADKRLTTYNSMEHATEFWLNEYWEKNTFFVLSG